MSEPPERPRLPLPVVVAGVALAAFGALAMIQWVVGAVFGLVRLLLLAAVVVAVVALLLWGGPGRD